MKKNKDDINEIIKKIIEKEKETIKIEEEIEELKEKLSKKIELKIKCIKGTEIIISRDYYKEDLNLSINFYTQECEKEEIIKLFEFIKNIKGNVELDIEESIIKIKA